MSEASSAVLNHTLRTPTKGMGLSASRQIEIQASPYSPSNALSEKVVTWGLTGCALLSVLTTLGILVILLEESAGFFFEVSAWDFFTGTEWFPLFEPRSFGVLPLIWGSLQIALGALVVAFPLGLFSAIYLSEYCPKGLKVPLKSSLEVLAGIPSVVYGYFALVFITPRLQFLFTDMEFFNALSAAIVVGIMVVPTIASISEDALSSVSKELREAAYGLGTRKFQVAMTVVLPAALSGVIASVILAFARAIGETMAVTLAAGATPKITMSYFESIQTMTAFIVQVSSGDTPQGTIEYKTIFAVGLILFATTLLFNSLARLLVRRFHNHAE